jgi:hypothetical protein
MERARGNRLQQHFRACRCRGYVRIDIRIDTPGNPDMLEKKRDAARRHGLGVIEVKAAD